LFFSLWFSGKRAAGATRCAPPFFPEQIGSRACVLLKAAPVAGALSIKHITSHMTMTFNLRRRPDVKWNPRDSEESRGGAGCAGFR